MGRTSGRNPKPKPEYLNQFRSGNSCDDAHCQAVSDFTLPLDNISGERRRVAWATADLPESPAQAGRYRSMPHIIQLLNFRTFLEDFAGSLHFVTMRELHKCVFCALAFNISSGRVR